MGIIKDVKEIKKQINDISSRFDNKIIKKAEKYDEIKKLLKNIKFNLKITQKTDIDGSEEFEITYILPKITLKYDDQGKIYTDNDLFTSINQLDLIEIDDFLELSKIYNSSKNKKM